VALVYLQEAAAVDQLEQMLEESVEPVTILQVAQELTLQEAAVLGC
jgi:hypothetical protein